MATPPMPPRVRAAFEAMSPQIRAGLEPVRELIFAQAEASDVGPLTETLKWGEPAYLTEQSKAGSTIRLGQSEGAPAVLFNCNTTLAEDFRDMFGDQLAIRGKRALLLSGAPQDAVAICLARALTYHRAKKARS